MKNFVYRNYTVEYLFDNTTHFSGYGDVSLPQEDYDNIILFYQLDPSKTPEKQIEEIEEIQSKISLITQLISDKRIIALTLPVEYQQNWQIKHSELSSAILRFNQSLKSLSFEQNNIKVVELNQFFENQTIDKVDWRFFFTSQMIINPKLTKPFTN